MPAEARWLSVRVAQERPEPYLISIPKSVVKLATRRNRLKRLIREVLRKDRKLPDTGRCYVFRVSRVPSEFSYGEVKKALEKLWE